MATIVDPPPFEEAMNCYICGSTFSTFKRRTLPQFGLNFLVRVCDECHKAPAPVPAAEPPAGHNRDSPKPRGGPATSATPSSSKAEPEDEEEEEEEEQQQQKAARRGPLQVVQPAVPAFDCTCGMPLCICEAPAAPPPPAPQAVAAGVASAPAAASASLAPKRAAPVAAAAAARPAAVTRTAPPAGGPSGMPSLFFTSGGLSSVAPRTPSQQYEATGEGMKEAVKNGDVEAVQSLLAKKVDPNYQDKQGLPLLHIAALFNQTEITFLLMSAGANPAATNAQGETALDCAPATLQHKMQEKIKLDGST
eukprot:jgi/Mesen1/4969/ME000248S04249